MSYACFINLEKAFGEISINHAIKIIRIAGFNGIENLFIILLENKNRIIEIREINDTKNKENINFIRIANFFSSKFSLEILLTLSNSFKSGLLNEVKYTA